MEQGYSTSRTRMGPATHAGWLLSGVQCRIRMVLYVFGFDFFTGLVSMMSYHV